jgi:hypothetical protein
MTIPGPSCHKDVGGGGVGSNPFRVRVSRGNEGDDDEEEREIIFPCSPLPEKLPSLGDLFGRQMRAPASARWEKCPRVDAGGVSSLPLQPSFTLVHFVLLAMCACITGTWMTYLPSAL